MEPELEELESVLELEQDELGAAGARAGAEAGAGGSETRPRTRNRGTANGAGEIGAVTGERIGVGEAGTRTNGPG